MAAAVAAQRKATDERLAAAEAAERREAEGRLAAALAAVTAREAAALAAAEALCVEIVALRRALALRAPITKTCSQCHSATESPTCCCATQPSLK